jgi:hypothetical protein
MTQILKGPLLGIINSRYSERFDRALGVHYSERALLLNTILRKTTYSYFDISYNLNRSTHLYKTYVN